jgi:hypothetical protein
MNSDSSSIAHFNSHKGRSRTTLPLLSFIFLGKISYFLRKKSSNFFLNRPQKMQNKSRIQVENLHLNSLSVTQITQSIRNHPNDISRIDHSLLRTDCSTSSEALSITAHQHGPQFIEPHPFSARKRGLQRTLIISTTY